MGKGKKEMSSEIEKERKKAEQKHKNLKRDIADLNRDNIFSRRVKDAMERTAAKLIAKIPGLEAADDDFTKSSYTPNLPRQNKGETKLKKRLKELKNKRKDSKAGGGKVGNKYFTGGMVNPSYGTEFDDR